MKPYLYNVSGESYIYYPLPMAFTAGEQWCRDSGSHLVAYTTEREQQRVRAGGQPRACWPGPHHGDTK